MTDPRRSSPAAQRNRDPILAVLKTNLPPHGLVIEIASGSGEHVVHFAAALPALTFQPTDADPDARASIDAYAGDAGLPNVRKALALDAASADWPVAAADAVICINMIHIAPWSAAEGLVRGCGRVIRPGGTAVLYGPYKRRGTHTAPSNAAFDASLRERDPRWGVRDIESVIGLFTAEGFAAPAVHEMPANNLCLVFHRGAEVPA